MWKLRMRLFLSGRMWRHSDAVSLRGQKHLRELMSMVERGHRAALIYCVARTDVDCVRAAYEVDPVYAETLIEARQKALKSMHCK